MIRTSNQANPKLRTIQNWPEPFKNFSFAGRLKNCSRLNHNDDMVVPGPRLFPRQGASVRNITGTCSVSVDCLSAVPPHSRHRKTLVGSGYWLQQRRCYGQWGRPCEHMWLRLLPPLTPKSTSDGSGDFSVKRKLKNSVFCFFFNHCYWEESNCMCFECGHMRILPRVSSQETIAIITVTEYPLLFRVCWVLLCFLYPRLLSSACRYRLTCIF